MNKVLGELGIDGKCIRAESNRHLAFYDVELDHRPSSLRKLRSSSNEIALALRTKTVPIMRVVPEEGIVRLQVALKDAEPVPLMDLLSGENLPKYVFPMLLGEDDAGRKLWIDMNQNPHLLIAGGTGSGKSTLLHTIIANALYNHALRFRNMGIYLNDPKRIEFQDYRHASLKGIVNNIASTYNDTVAQLEYLSKLMEDRYALMAGYNMRSVEENPGKMAVVLCVIDEVADLMMQDKKGHRLETLIVKLAQRGRACGIFLILATQRPSVDIITGLIKANFPGRIACKTASRKDSEVILDRCGAEALLGRGDAILQNMKYAGVRFQVAYTTPQDTIYNFQEMTKKVNNK
jgi:S-DNA-T family DNA segregation ATPase FtsK/SpoIIIE